MFVININKSFLLQKAYRYIGISKLDIGIGHIGIGHIGIGHIGIGIGYYRYR